MGRDLRIPNNTTRIKLIGYFYEKITAHIFGGTVSAKQNDRSGDIRHDEWRARLEVKACGNHSRLAVYDYQLDAHLTDFSVEFPACVYCLWTYRNWRWRKPQKPLIGETPTRRTLYKYLAMNTMTLHMFDITVLDAIRERGISSMMFRDGESESILRLSRTLLKQFDSPIRTFDDFGLAKNYYFTACNAFALNGFGFPMNFQATFVLEKSLRKNLQSRLQDLEAQNIATIKTR